MSVLEHIYVVIMAGGSGTRFWPMSTEERPKQFLNLVTNRSMIEETVARVSSFVDLSHIYIMTNKKYVSAVRNLLNIPKENVIGEPEQRDTAPCIALASTIIHSVDENGIMVVLPSDHLIKPVELFKEDIMKAVDAARSGYLVTIGIKPNYPATVYGYIESETNDFGNFFSVKQFKEKPCFDVAKKFIASGNYYWNSGIFVWNVNIIYQEIKRYNVNLSHMMDSWNNGINYEENYKDCESISIDYCVMEKSNKVFMVKASFEWNDIGTWNSLKKELPLDNDNNVVKGNIEIIESKDNILINDDSNVVIGVVGLNNVAVVKSGNRFLVCSLDKEDKVKQLVKELKND